MILAEKWYSIETNIFYALYEYKNCSTGDFHGNQPIQEGKQRKKLMIYSNHKMKLMIPFI